MGANSSTPSTGTSDSAAACPVDHKTRAAWLAQNQGSTPHAPPPSADQTSPPAKKHRQLSHDREISSIPRVFPDSVSLQPASQTQNNVCPSPYAQSHATPSNSESETGHDAHSGNWIYPSERQFYDALMRKNTPNSSNSTSDLATSVASIIPIHNAVNERAWSEILTWESQSPTTDPGSAKCGGPKLYSFRGLGVESQFLSPRARFNGLLGYQLPFDRHDWVVERCGGQRVEYVIDFYQGRSGKDGKLNFHLDVRPKLNSWEGWRMRGSRLVGLS